MSTSRDGNRSFVCNVQNKMVPTFGDTVFSSTTARKSVRFEGKNCTSRHMRGACFISLRQNADPHLLEYSFLCCLQHISLLWCEKFGAFCSQSDTNLFELLFFVLINRVPKRYSFK